MNTIQNPFQRFTHTFQLTALIVCALCVPTSLAAASDFTSPIQPSANSALNMGQGVLAKKNIEGVLEVALDPALLEQLPKRGQFTMHGFPVGPGQTIDLELEHMEVKLADAHAVCTYPGPVN